MENDWTSSHGLTVGDSITAPLRRHWSAIWWERITTLRWHVEPDWHATFVVTEVVSGTSYELPD